MSNEKLLIIPVPALVVVLLAKEREKGSPLTEAEVLDIRDKAECTAMPVDVVPKLVDVRGYVDIDPENVWQEWQAARVQMKEYLE